jgi:hypothetical protein
MTISRGQMKRQLYMGGGIMDVVPREPAIVGGIKKAFKKATNVVKDVVSSDIGKAALLAAGAYYAPAMFGGTAGFGAGSTYGNFAKGLMSPNLIGPMTKAGGIGRNISSALTGKAGVGLGIAALGGIFGGAMAGKSEEEVEALTRDVPALKSYLTQYYTNLNPELRNQPEKVEEFVNSQIAEYNQGKGGYAMGGRIGYDSGTPDPKIPEEFLEDLKRRKLNEMLDQYYRFQEDYERRKDMAPTQEAANGGRMQYALGDTASQNAMQAAGIEGLPIRQNPKGVKELDLRDNGGFIPPVGIKEKEDDIPAMLSNNEFVFTADAVRGMGDGDVELGAQRMYDQMKTLEEGGRV